VPPTPKPPAPPNPSNGAIAAAFEELGDLYELDGAIIHRVVAYRSAARAVRDAPVSVAALAREGRATELSGIGETLQQKIVELADTGTLAAAEKLRSRFPPGLIDLTRLPGMGPKRARRLFDELGLASLEALREAAAAQRLRGLRGFGAKFEETVLAALDAGVAERTAPRFLLHRALGQAERLVEGLVAAGGPEVRVEVAGSARRMADSVKDLDIVAAGADPALLTSALAELDVVESCERTGDAGARARAHTGLAIDFRVVEHDQFGNLLQHLTGSKEHNMALRDMAVRKGLHVSEYGVLDDASGDTHRCTTEQEVYALLGLEYIEPDPVVHIPFPDGTSLTQWRDLDGTCEEFAKFSRNDAEAYKWFSLAQQKGSDAAKSELQALEKTLKPAERREGERRVKVWVQEHRQTDYEEAEDSQLQG